MFFFLCAIPLLRMSCSRSLISLLDLIKVIVQLSGLAKILLYMITLHCITTHHCHLLFEIRCFEFCVSHDSILLFLKYKFFLRNLIFLFACLFNMSSKILILLLENFNLGVLIFWKRQPWLILLSFFILDILVCRTWPKSCDTIVICICGWIIPAHSTLWDWWIFPIILLYLVRINALQYHIALCLFKFRFTLMSVYRSILRRLNPSILLISRCQHFPVKLNSFYRLILSLTLLRLWCFFSLMNYLLTILYHLIVVVQIYFTFLQSYLWLTRAVNWLRLLGIIMIENIWKLDCFLSSKTICTIWTSLLVIVPCWLREV